MEPYSNIGLQLAGRFKENKDYIVFDSPAQTNTFFQMQEVGSHYSEHNMTPQTFADIAAMLYKYLGHVMLRLY